MKLLQIFFVNKYIYMRNKYETLEKIGQGQEGAVYLVQKCGED